MSCSDCAKTFPIPECTDELVIGQALNPFDNIFIYVRDVATGRVEKQNRQIDLFGNILMSLLEPSKDFYKAGKDYEVWISGTLIIDLEKGDTPFLISPSPDPVKCVLISFSKVYESGTLVTNAKSILSVV